MTQQKNTKKKPTQAKKKPAPAKKAPAVPTNEELFILKSSIEKLKQGGSNTFKLAMMDDEYMLDPEVRKLKELQVPSTDFKKYQQEHMKLLQKHAEIDEKRGTIAFYSQPHGQGVRVSNPGPNSYLNIVHNEAGYKKAKKALEEKYKETLSARDKQMKEFNETLQQPAKKLNFVKVSRASIPDDIEVEYEELKVFRKWLVK